MALSNVKLSIIISTHNRSESLKETLNSLLNQNYNGEFNYKIIVVDNNSKDNTKEVVESYIPRFSGRLQYLFDSRKGKPYALNTGIREADGEIIAFTDDDVILHKDWLKNIKKYFDIHADISGIAGKVIPKFVCPKPSWLSFDEKFLLKGPLNYYNHGNKSFYLEPGEKPFLGGNMALRKEVFEKHGLFNENLKRINGRYLIGEDSEYYHYISGKGEKIVYTPDVIVEHKFYKSDLTKRHIRNWYRHIGMSTILIDNRDDSRKLYKVPLWLLKDTINSFLKFVISHIKLNRAKTFYYETRFHFNIGKIKGYLYYDKYSVPRLNAGNRTMKVAFVNTEFLPIPPVEGGAVEEWIEQIAQGLNEKFKVYIFSIFHKTLLLYERKKNIEYFRFKPGLFSKIMLCSYRLPFKKDKSWFFYFPYSLWVAFKLMRIRPDIIHIHNRPHFVWIMKLLNPKSKIILHIHQLSAMDERNLWTEKFVRQVDLFLGCSRFIAEQIKKRVPLTKDKVAVIHNGLKIKKFSPAWLQTGQRDNLRQRYAVNGQKVILYVGRLTENKGVHLLVEAFRDMLKADSLKTKLFICGAYGYSNRTQTSYIRHLHNLASDIEDKVVFAGYVPHTEIHNYYLIADLVVIPSEVEEGFCIITIESLASGIPVIASKKGGIPEIIRDKETGILINNLSKDTLRRGIEDFLKNENAYVQYSVQGRQFVESNFTWNKISADLEKLYLNLIKNA